MLGLQAGETRALHPSRASAALPGRPPVSPAAIKPPSWPGMPQFCSPRLLGECFQASPPSLGSLWPRGTPEHAPAGRARADGGLSAPGPGQAGQWVSYAARQQGHTSPALAALAAKNSPSCTALPQPAARMLFFWAGPPCSWCFGFKTPFPRQPGPPAHPAAGAHEGGGSGASRGGPWGFLVSVHLL